MSLPFHFDFRLRTGAARTLLMLCLMAGVRLHGQATPDASPAPLLVAATSDNYPYSFVDQKGQVSGFAVDVFDAVARQMNLKFTRVVGPATEVGERFIARELHVHPFFSPSRVRPGQIEHSVSFVTLQLTAFVRRGDERFATIEDLRRQSLRIVAGGAGRDYGRAQKIPETSLGRAELWEGARARGSARGREQRGGERPRPKAHRPHAGRPRLSHRNRRRVRQ